MKIKGAATPSEAFSATVSTAARVMPARSSTRVSRPTIIETARLAPSVSSASRRSFTARLSFARSLAARSWLQKKASAANKNRRPNILSIRTAAAMGSTVQTLHITRTSTSPAKKSLRPLPEESPDAPPELCSASRPRSRNSKALIILPIRRTGWGSQRGSPISQSIRQPASSAHPWNFQISSIPPFI